MRWDSEHGGGNWKANSVTDCLDQRAAPPPQGSFFDEIVRALSPRTAHGRPAAARRGKRPGKDRYEPVLRTADLLVCPVLSRDRQAMADLVLGTLGPLTTARDRRPVPPRHAHRLLRLRCVAAEAARRLSLSARGMAYRLG